MQARAAERLQMGRAKRVMRELAKLKEIPEVREVSLKHPDDTNVIVVSFATPVDRPFKGQVHTIEITLTHQKHATTWTYPINPPRVVFKTPIFHPNVGELHNGGASICLDILNEQNKWSEMNSLTTIVQSIMALVDQPNTASPLNSRAARKWAACAAKRDFSTYLE